MRKSQGEFLPHNHPGRPSGAGRRSLVIFELLGTVLSLALTGCASSPPVVTVERINVPTYLKIPDELTKDCAVQLPANVTWGEALGLYDAALKACQAQISGIQSLRPPSQNPP